MMISWLRSPFRWILMLAASYVGVIVVLLLIENSLVFKPTPAAEEWWEKPSPEVQDLELTSADGHTIHAWWWPVEGSRGAILYCHGNAGNLSHRAGSIMKLRERLGDSVLIFDYPGYGKSSGKPSEAGCYAAADAAYDFLLKQHIEPGRILLYGGSLGGGIAVDLAYRKKNYRALVLAKTFTSLPDVGKSQFPWLPVHWLMSNRFDNLDKIVHLRRPLFIGHGTRDGVVPFDLGRRLFEAANQPKEFFEDHGDHNDPFPDSFFTRLTAFLQACEGTPPAISAKN